MPKIVWDEVGERFYETGVSKCVLYPQTKEGKYPKGVAWNGITGITESPSGAEATDLYADNIKYATLRSAETFGATIEAYTSPDEWALCDGSAEPIKGVRVGQQSRSSFGLTYVTEIGSDTSGGDSAGYKIHFIYGGSASPSERGYSTKNESPEAITFSWEVTTTPVSVSKFEGFKPTSFISISSLDISEKALKAIEDAIYGTEEKEATLPTPDELFELITTADPSLVPESLSAKTSFPVAING